MSLPNDKDLRRMLVDALCAVRGGKKLPVEVVDKLMVAVETWADMKPGLVEWAASLTPPPSRADEGEKR